MHERRIRERPSSLKQKRPPSTPQITSVALVGTGGDRNDVLDVVGAYIADSRDRMKSLHR